MMVCVLVAATVVALADVRALVAGLALSLVLCTALVLAAPYPLRVERVWEGLPVGPFWREFPYDMYVMTLELILMSYWGALVWDRFAKWAPG